MKILDETGLKFIATKFKELRDSLTNKVDKVTGKDLSTNDYTNEAKAKVDAIPADPKYTDTVQDLSGYAKKEDLSNKIDKSQITDKYGGFSSDMVVSQKGVKLMGIELLRNLSEKPNKSDIPTKLSQLENDKTFKTEVEIQSMISKTNSFKKEIVASLPSTGKDNVFYLLKDTNGKDNNNYLEYLWIDNKWELIGSTQVDLSEYVTKEKDKAVAPEDANLSNPEWKVDDKFVTPKFLSEYVSINASNLASVFKLFLEDKADRKEIKTKLSEMSDDATHRLVTDTEKETWNGKIDKSMVLYNSDPGSPIDPNSDEGKKLVSYRFFDEQNEQLSAFIPFFVEQKIKEKLPDMSKYKQQVILTQTEYDALSSTDKNDASKIYFIKA